MYVSKNELPVRMYTVSPRCIRLRLFSQKPFDPSYLRCIMLFSEQISVQWITQLVSLILIPWRVIDPVDSGTQRLKTRSLVSPVYHDTLLFLVS